MVRDFPESPDEDEIFKSLSHQIRRNIIRVLGNQQSLTFTEIRDAISGIDSPSLSYHLKSLKSIIDQDGNRYKLTDIGLTALLLISRIDDSESLKNSTRKFKLANIITICCWTIVQFAVPFSISHFPVEQVLVPLAVLLQVVPQVNYFIIWQLWGRSWTKTKKTMVVPSGDDVE
jgi:DNA-binding transcriptional ArsR family regulator